MKLLRLRLENFRQHQLSEVEFRQGMTAIVGENGTGKTTILEAISFALYGDIRGNVDSIRFYWSDSNKFSVRLTFEFDGSIFEVERSTNDAYLKQLDADRLWATGKRQTVEACERLLGLTYEQFINSFCAEQKALAFLHFKTNTARQDEVARMLGYDRLKSAEAIAIDRRKSFASRRATIQQYLADPNELENQRKEATLRADEAKSRSAETKKALKEIEAALPAAKKQAAFATQFHEISANMTEIRGRAEGLKSNLDTTAKTLESAQKDLTERDILQPLEEEFQSLSEILAQLAKEYEAELRRQELQKQADTALAEVERLEKEIAALPEAAVSAAEKKLQSVIQKQTENAAAITRVREDWQRLRTEADSRVAAATVNRSNAQNALSHAEEMLAKGICPECGQAVGTSYQTTIEARKAALKTATDECTVLEAAAKKLTEAPPELLKLQAAEQELKTEHSRCQAEYSDAREQAARRQALTQQQATQRAAREKLLAQLTATPSRFDAAKKKELEEKQKALEPKHARYLAIADAPARAEAAKKAHEKAKQEHDAARERYRALEAERKQLPFETVESAKAAEAALTNLETQVKVLTGELESLKKLEDAAKRELEQANARLKEYKQKLRDLKELEREEALHDCTGKELRALRVALNNELGPELSARASENLELLTNGRYTRLQLDKNFSPSVIDDDDVLKAVISGGEEDVVALSLRLALSELIQERQGRPMSLLILDEVFGSLDVDRRQAVLERLAALKSRFEQILVISHIEEINQVADQCLYLRRNQNSRAAVVSDVPPEGFDLVEVMG